MSDTALVIMARYPEPGKTKTRLARHYGNVETARLYQAFLTDLAAKFANQDYALTWTYTPPEVDYEAFVQNLLPHMSFETRCFPQQGEGLGDRLLHAFQWTAAQGYQNTILIGSDSPQVDREIIQQARLALEEVDVVLGPAEDGGYYLIAMRQPYDVFSGIQMSTDSVLDETVALAQSQNLTTRLLTPCFDIDEIQDLQRLVDLLQHKPELAPLTANLLAAQLESKRSFFSDDNDTSNKSRNPATFDLHRANQPL